MNDILKGTTNLSDLIFIQDSSSTTGAGLTGVTASMLTVNYMRVEDDNDVTIASISMSDLTGTGTVHTDGGIEEISPAAPGWYRIDLPDAMFATGARFAGLSVVDAASNNIAQVTLKYKLVDYDPEDGVRLGLTTLPNAAADAAGGLPISDVGGLDLDTLNSNVSAILTDTSTTLDNLVDDLESRLGTPSDLGSGATIAANLVDIEGQTDDIGAAGAGLTAVPYNSAWDAEIQSEVNDALVAFFTSSAQLVDDIWDEAQSGHVASGSFGEIATEIASILSDTDELQGDWADGGRLDLILDARASQTTADAIETDTQDIQTQIGTAGAGLTDLGGMSTGMMAEVQTEANDALVANNLDHLMLTAVPVSFFDTVDPDSVIGWLAHDGTGTGTTGGGFNRTTDSLEAIANSSSTPPTAAAIADAVWDEAQADHTSAGSFGETATEIAGILADTNELQTDDVPGLIAALNDPTAATIADAVWDEAQADHVSAGSFGLIASEIADILTDTAEIGAAGAGLTAVPWNSTWDAEVQSEVTDALEAMNLDHLMLSAVDTDFETTVHADSVIGYLAHDGVGTGTSGFDRTSDSLEAIAGAGSGGAPTAAQVADAVWDEAQSGHTSAGSFGELATEIASILADTDELQTDWVDGGRLDLIVDAILVDTGTTLDGKLDTIDGIVDNILVDTAEIGTAGAGLTDLGGMSTAMKAEVQTEANDALVANNLDHLVLSAVDTDFDTTVHSDSVLGYLAHDGTGTGSAGYDRTQDSLEAISGATGGSSPTAAQIADAVWDESQGDHTSAGSFGEVATEVASILADTNELQGDWTDGGRLDLILDGILVDTGEIGSAGAGLTAVPWNSDWDAEVQSEVNDALVALHLDHLLAVDYDPASQPGVATALLNELVENDGGVSRFTTNALEQGPSGGGALTAQQVWEYTTRTLTQPSAQIATILAGTTVTIHRGDTVTISFTGLGDISDYDTIYFTIKQKTSDPADAAARVQVSLGTGTASDGLLILNGDDDVTSTDASITISDSTNGDLDVVLNPNMTQDLVPSSNYTYDIQMVKSDETVSTLASGDCTINEDVTRAIT